MGESTRVGLETHLGAVRQRFPATPESCRVLLLGEDNPYGSEPEFALYCAPTGCAGHRLQSHVLGIPRADYLGIWRANLCTGGWSAKAARARALALTAGHDTPWRIVVALGVKVSSAFGHADVRKAVTRAGIELVRIGHPSRRNTTYNKPAVVEAARGLVRAVAPELWPS
jgi:hypothetical protein